MKKLDLSPIDRQLYFSYNIDVQWARITDVNVNRLDETLKFIEDLTRFSLEDKSLLARIRKTRRAFLKVKKALPLSTIVSSRKSHADLGRVAAFDSQTTKTPYEVVIANIARAKQAARILEETVKVRHVRASQALKEIRFQVYDYEKLIIAYLEKRFNPRIYAIIDEVYLSTSPIKDIVSILEDNGATMIQLRITTLSDKEFCAWAGHIRVALRNKEIKFIINNRLDIAIACHADGVHLGQDDMSVRQARAIAGEHYIIGVSAHTVAQAREAEAEDADYIGVGAIYPTRTKIDAHVCGISVLNKICRSVSIPVVGIGGITKDNYKAVFKAGAAGIALSSYLFEGDIRKNIRALTLKKY